MEHIVTIRRAKPSDYRQIELVTRAAFWNVYVPGCTEHYLAHILRAHADFVPELDLVLEVDGKIIGSVMYTQSKIVGAGGEQRGALTFGPYSVLPQYQRRGYGRRLLEFSFVQALELGYASIIICGSPSNYVKHGFKSCKKYRVSLPGGVYPAALLVKELRAGAFAGDEWTYYASDAFTFDRREAQKFDASFPQWEKKYQPSQEEFYIYSNAVIQ